MDAQNCEWKYVPFGHAGVTLLMPSGLRVSRYTEGFIAKKGGTQWLLFTVFVIGEPARAARREELLRGPVVSTEIMKLRLVRDRSIAFPYVGWERVREDELILPANATPHRNGLSKSGPVGSAAVRRLSEHSWFWGLLLRCNGVAVSVESGGAGHFDELTERNWRTVVDSIRIGPQAVPQPVPEPKQPEPVVLVDRDQQVKDSWKLATRTLGNITRRLANQDVAVGDPEIHTVLSVADRSAELTQFPTLDHGYIYLADTRLSAYGNRKCWAVIIEILGYNPRATGCEGFADALYCFGNCLKGQPPSLSDVGSVYTISGGPNGPLFSQGNDLNTDAESLRIRDIAVPINRDPVFLASKRVGPRFDAPHLKAYAMRQNGPSRKNLLDAARRIEDAGGAEEFRGQDLLRSLVPEHRNLLLATDGELSQRLSVELPLLLRLDQWHHPDISAGELPSESEAFKMIAEVLATGDASRYKPTQEPNTHWSNWPMGGDL